MKTKTQRKSSDGIEAMLKHSRKSLKQRTGKLLSKHGNETLNGAAKAADKKP